MIIEFTVLGDPKAQKRHKHFKKGEFVGVYDPSAKDKKDFIAAIYQYAPETPIDEPIFLQANFYFQRPKSHFRTGKNSHLLKDNAPVMHTGTPDVDNCYKYLSDSMNKIFYRDDSLICSIQVTKQYSDKPRTEITIIT